MSYLTSVYLAQVTLHKNKEAVLDYVDLGVTQENAKWFDTTDTAILTFQVPTPKVDDFKARITAYDSKAIVSIDTRNPMVIGSDGNTRDVRSNSPRGTASFAATPEPFPWDTLQPIATPADLFFDDDDSSDDDDD